MGELAALHSYIDTISKSLKLLVNDITEAAKNVDASSQQVADGAAALKLTNLWVRHLNTSEMPMIR